MRKIAITGGPCGAKTTALQALLKTYGSQVAVMDEIATKLLSNGFFPRPVIDVPLTQEWLYDFENIVLAHQLGMENQFAKMAEGNNTRVLLFDRGVLDIPAYLGRGLDYFLEVFRLNLPDLYARYDAVLHLESVAVSNPSLYEKLKSTNPSRYESAELAAERDAEIKEMWKGHPNWHCIQGGRPLGHIVSEVQVFVGSFLFKEIERKWVLPALPSAPIDLSKGVIIEQGYFPFDEEMRLRHMGDEFFITFKDSGGLMRSECERTIEPWAFRAQWKNTDGRRILKTRYSVPYEGFTLEFDVYGGKLTGLITLEVEFDSKAIAARFRLPKWVRSAFEATKDMRFKNRVLAEKGLPYDFRKLLRT